MMLGIFAGIVLVFGGLIAAEPLLRRFYVHHLNAMTVEQNSEERIVTYPLA